MNIKLVVVWAIAILIFAFIGIFGYANRDLLIKNDIDNFEPIKTNTSVIHTCTKTMSNGVSSYTFYFDTSMKINKVNVKYVATDMNAEAYSSATTINNMTINGVTTTLNGMSNNFTFTMNVDLAQYNKTELGILTNDLLNLSIVINDIDNYDSYKSIINNIDVNSSYRCD